MEPPIRGRYKAMSWTSVASQIVPIPVENVIVEDWGYPFTGFSRISQDQGYTFKIRKLIDFGLKIVAKI